ncbi:MAG: hypothetical protein HY016_08375 [Nitrosomonadales bacterium]|nr:hypothetical protein [Nitrosomonadales bacterium]
MNTLALDAIRLFRSALHAIALYLSIIMIASMTIAKPANAEGTVTPVATLSFFVNGIAYSSRADACQGYANFVNARLAQCPYGSAYYCYSGYLAWQSTTQSKVNLSNNYCQWGRFEKLFSAIGVPDTITFYDMVYIPSSITCPKNSTGTTTCTCTAPYVPDATATSCVPAACPAHASRATPSAPCACETGYQLNAAGTSCVSICPIDPLPSPPPPFDDACSNSLEKGNGVDVDNACPNLLSPEMKAGSVCLANKINKLALPVPYTGSSATVRTAAYQNHLLAVWNKLIEIEDKKLTDTQKLACASVITDVGNEMAWHGLDAPPSKKGNQAPHVLGNALDIPMDVVNAMITKVTTPPTISKLCLICTPVMLPASDVQDYINSATANPPACNLRWGGRFKHYDPVHFQLP